MRKLLGLLGILTITSSTIPTNILNNSFLTKLENLNLKKHKYLEPIIDKDKDQIKCVSVDSSNNVYFGTEHTNWEKGGFYKTIDQGKTITKIANISSDIYYTFVDKKDNIYFSGDNNFYVLKKGETNPILISDFFTRKNEFAMDSNNNIYFIRDGLIYILENNSTTVHKTDFDAKNVTKITIDENDNIYYSNSHSVNLDNKDHIFVIKNNEKKSEDIANIPIGSVNVIALDKQNNIFVGTDFYTYVLKKDEKWIKHITKIYGSYFIVIDEENNVYFTNYQNNSLYMLSKNKISKRILVVKKIEELERNKGITYVTNNSNNIYFCASDSSYSNIYKLVK